MTDTGPDAGTRRVVYGRSGGLCERCRARPGVDVHHRRARGSGGSTAPGINSPANLVHLCRACHEWVETNWSDAAETGWKISLQQQPTDATGIPLRDLAGRTFLLDAEGSAWIRREQHEMDEPDWF